MYKTVGIYGKMENLQEFERFYISEFMPRMLKLPGVIEMKISKLVPTQLPDQDPEFQEIQLMVETYYESAETIRQLMGTEEGRQLGSLLSVKCQGKIGAYVAQEYKVKSSVVRL
ncbi:EthD family reductase [Kroppenstedtia eburnea]|uniref:EthD family reductase n=1 Tax=Kroppenstedtia eburnea TaxID=714067 RepID=UPI0036439B03